MIIKLCLTCLTFVRTSWLKCNISALVLVNIDMAVEENV